MRRAAFLPEKGERRRDPARGLREISLAEGAPEGISPLLRPTAGGAAGVRGGHGHRSVAVSYTARFTCWSPRGLSTGRYLTPAQKKPRRRRGPGTVPRLWHCRKNWGPPPHPTTA